MIATAPGGDDAEMFDLAPVSLWLEDFSGVRQLFEEVARRRYLRSRPLTSEDDPSRIKACSERIRVLKVNARTLALFEAADLADLVGNLGKVFRDDDMLDRHVEELASLWNGRTEFFSHSVNYSLSGRRIDIQMTGRVLPGLRAKPGAGAHRHRRRDRARDGAEPSTRPARTTPAVCSSHSPVSLWVRRLQRDQAAPRRDPRPVASRELSHLHRRASPNSSSAA